jgi:hypothetical protein
VIRQGSKYPFLPRASEPKRKTPQPNAVRVKLERANPKSRAVGSEGLPGRVPLPADEAWKVCHQIVEGLEAAHEKGIVHSDVIHQDSPKAGFRELDLFWTNVRNWRYL